MSEPYICIISLLKIGFDFHVPILIYLFRLAEHHFSPEYVESKELVSSELSVLFKKDHRSGTQNEPLLL